MSEQESTYYCNNNKLYEDNTYKNKFSLLLSLLNSIFLALFDFYDFASASYK